MVPSWRYSTRVWTLACVLVLLVPLVPLSSSDDIGPVPQDDAGSGRDAPDEPSKDIMILPGVIYQASSHGPLDLQDHYHFVGEAGQRFEGWSDGNLGCYYLLDANGDPLDNGCSYTYVPLGADPLRAVLPYTGDYYFRIALLAPAVYTFAYNLSGEVPEVRLFNQLMGAEAASKQAEPLPVPHGCDGDFVMVPGLAGPIPRFTDGCYHMRTGLNGLDTPNIDVLIIPPATMYPERDLRTMREAVEMWDEGIHSLAVEMGMQWLADGVDFDIFIDDDRLRTDPLWDPEIVVVATNPVGGAGIGIDAPSSLFGAGGPCHGQPNPLAGLEDWASLPGFDSHHDDRSGTYTADCAGGGAVCYAVNGAIDPAPGVLDVFGLFDLVAHEVGHCLTIGHVGDANDHEAETVPYADIMAYRNQPHDKCVSTLDVASFAITMSRFFLDVPMAANDPYAHRSPFQIQHPDDHRYASPTGLAEDCPVPDSSIVPGGDPDVVPSQDDAGSGRDAPDDHVDDITILPDVVYEGMSPGPIADNGDVYHLVGEAGQMFKGWSDGNTGCYTLFGASGEEIGRECSYGGVPMNSGPLAVELPYPGDYYLRIAHITPATYKFAFSLTGDPPDVRLLPAA